MASRRNKAQQRQVLKQRKEENQARQTQATPTPTPQAEPPKADPKPAPAPARDIRREVEREMGDDPLDRALATLELSLQVFSHEVAQIRIKQLENPFHELTRAENSALKELNKLVLFRLRMLEKQAERNERRERARIKEEADRATKQPAPNQQKTNERQDLVTANATEFVNSTCSTDEAKNDLSCTDWQAHIASASKNMNGDESCLSSSTPHAASI